MILKLNKQIYDAAAVENAINAYRQLAAITLSEDAAHWCCTFRDCVYSESLTVSEFENYVIDLMNSKHYDHS